MSSDYCLFSLRGGEGGVGGRGWVVLWGWGVRRRRAGGGVDDKEKVKWKMEVLGQQL